jgi:hypothetical protein
LWDYAIVYGVYPTAITEVICMITKVLVSLIVVHCVLFAMFISQASSPGTKKGLLEASEIIINNWR